MSPAERRRLAAECQAAAHEVFAAVNRNVGSELLQLDLPMGQFKTIAPGGEVSVETTPSVVALDGEREVDVLPADDVRIRLQTDGPLVVDIEKTLKEAARKGFFIIGT